MYEKIFGLLPPFLRDYACIAGGFAASERLAGDIDLWVLNYPGRTDHLWENISEYLRHNEVKFRETMFSYASTNGSTLRFVLRDHYVRAKDDFLDVQILEAHQFTPGELVEAFDISTHMIALTQNETICGRRWTGIHETPVVLRFDKPEGVTERLDKICKRYGITARPEDLAELEILTQAEAVNDGLSEDAAVGF